MREIIARFTNTAASAVKVHTPGSPPLPVKVGDKVHPPGLFHSGDADQLARLIASGCLSPDAVSHAPLEIDREAFLGPEAAHAAAPVVGASPASQDGGVGEAGTDAETHTGGESGSGGMRLADGNRGGFARDGAKPRGGGRRGGAPGKGAKG